MAKGGLLKEHELRQLCDEVKNLLKEESNVVMIKAPVVIFGDIHGQFQDLLEMLKVGGPLPETNYCFMGDFVDRGYYSVETFTYLMILKFKYPDQVTLLRGNHESRNVSNVYGLYDEVLRKYGNANPWRYFTEVFDCLNIAALINGSIMCVHGGLSPLCRSID